MLNRSELSCIIGEELFYSFVHYVKNFGDKPCAFSDLRPFIGLLSSDQQHSMLDEIKTLANVEDYPKSVSFSQYYYY